jgi:enoyl-CoA hydratase/carnithine racemase
MNTDYRTVRYQSHAGVGTLMLSRPEKRNAMNPEMRRELVQLGDLLATDDTLRCLIVTGDGLSFCAGLELTEDMAGTLAQFSERPIDDKTVGLGLVVAGALEWLPRLPCPSIAAVAGHAYGAGLQLAIACDFRILAGPGDAEERWRARLSNVPPNVAIRLDGVLATQRSRPTQR